MTGLKRALAKGALMTMVAGGVLVASATAASADVACNRWGECWRVREHYTTYPTTVGILFHDDAWYAAHHHDRHWHWRKDRDDDHGYYEHGVWHPF
ncbi:MAG: hypothetical protein ACYC8V_00090 [Caulobacteraceae bacterium]